MLASEMGFSLATCVYLRGSLPVRLATQRKSLPKFNLSLLATICDSVLAGLNSCSDRNFCHLQLDKYKAMEVEFIISRKC